MKVSDYYFRNVQLCSKYSFITVAKNTIYLFDSQNAKLIFKKEFSSNYNLRHAHWLAETNIISISAENSPKSQGIVYIYDLENDDILMEYEMEGIIISSYLYPNKILLICPYDVYCYSFPNDSILINQYFTFYNPEGIVGFSLDGKFIVSPHKKIGWIEINLLDRLGESGNSPITYKAHENGIRAISVSNNNSLIATASEKGTIIRLYSMETRQIIYQLRRSSEPGRIYSMGFTSESDAFFVSSDSGTLHVFSIKDSPRKSFFSLFYSTLSTLSPNVSISLQNKTPFILSSYETNSIICIYLDGLFMKVSYYLTANPYCRIMDSFFIPKFSERCQKMQNNASSVN